MKNLVNFFSLIAVLLSCENSSSAQWVQTSGPNVTVYSLAVGGKNLFAGTNNGVFLTTNNGSTWKQVNTGLSDTGVSALAAIGTNVFASTSSGVFLSTNNGSAWTQVNTGLTGPAINKLAVVGTNLFGASNGGGIFATTNNGTSWTPADGTVFQNAFIALLSGAGSSIFASSTSNNIIYRSTDNGTTWQTADSGISTANAIIQSGSNLIAGGVSGMFLSSNNAVSWTQPTTYWGVQYTQVIGFAASESNVYGVCDGQVLLGANNGASWSGISLPAFFPTMTSIAIIDTNLFVGTQNGPVWRISTNQVVTGVKSKSDAAPATFGLGQNYPNPFNPSTQIRFSTAKAGMVTLKIYDLLGREVATLVNQELNPSSYSATWNASNVASGAYFCRLQSGNDVQTKKLLLMK